MSVDEILDMMDDLVDRAWTLPMTGKSAVDASKLRDFIDDIRLNMPSEIKQARAIVSDRSDIISAARREADIIVKKAEQRAKAMVESDAIVKQSKEKATEIMTVAQSKSREVRQAAFDYADGVMKRAEESLIASCNDIKNARRSLKTTRQEK